MKVVFSLLIVGYASAFLAAPRNGNVLMARSSKQFGINGEAKASAPEQQLEMDYLNQVKALNRLLTDTEDQLAQIKTLAINLKQLELEDPTLSKLPDSADGGLKTALQEAKAAAEVHGPDSSESDAAWKEVEFCTEIMGGVECSVDSMYRYSAAALKAHHQYDAVVDPTLYQEAEEAVSMLENLKKFIAIETSRLS